MKPIKLIAKDCGRHYGMRPGPCAKCQVLGSKSLKYRQGLQAGGTPAIALLGPIVRPGYTLPQLVAVIVLIALMLGAIFPDARRPTDPSRPTVHRQLRKPQPQLEKPTLPDASTVTALADEIDSLEAQGQVADADELRALANEMGLGYAR